MNQKPIYVTLVICLPRLAGIVYRDMVRIEGVSFALILMPHSELRNGHWFRVDTFMVTPIHR